MKRLFAAALLALALACGGLGGPDLEPPPRGAAPAPAAAPRPSFVSAPLTVSLATLESALDKSLPGALYQERDRKVAPGITADIVARRDGPVAAEARGGRLVVNLPVQVRAAAHGGGISLAQASGRLQVQVTLQPRLEPSWALQGGAAVTHRWLDAPRLKAGPVVIDLTSTVDGELRQRWPKVAAEIDAALLADTTVRRQAEALWSRLGQPYDLGGGLLLRFTPQALYADDLAVTPAGLRARLSAAGLLEAAVGSPLAPVSPGPLPSPQAGAPGSGFHLSLPVQIAWTALRAQAEPRLLNQAFTAEVPGGAATATVREILDLYPSGSGLALGLRFDLVTPAGSAEGLAWLTGTPTVADGSLRLSDPTLTADADRAWADAALELAAGAIQQELAKQLVFPVDEPLAALRKQAAAALASREVSPGVRLAGALADVRLTGARVTDAALVLDAEARGTLEVALSE